MVRRRRRVVGTVAALALALACGLGGCARVADLGALVPPTAEQDPRVPQVALTVAGRTRAVHVEAYGDPSKPALLVLHGSLGDLRAMRPFRELAGAYHVILWDQRGNGLSERVTAEEYTWDAVVEEIDAVRALFAPDEEAVTVLGHSFGAMYAALYASRHPERVKQLVLIEPGGLNGQVFTETYADVIQIDLFDPGLNQMFWQNEVLTPSDHEAMDYRALMILHNGHQTNYWCDRERLPRWPVWRPGAFVEHMRGVRMGAGAGAFTFDFAQGFQGFPREVLLIAGTCSALGPAFQARYHVPLFGRARLEVVQGAGHRLFAEDWPRTRAILVGYLSELRGP